MVAVGAAVTVTVTAIGRNTGGKNVGLRQGVYTEGNAPAGQEVSVAVGAAVAVGLVSG